jgi:hypothetical protein
MCQDQFASLSASAAAPRRAQILQIVGRNHLRGAKGPLFPYTAADFVSILARVTKTMAINPMVTFWRYFYVV